MGLYNDLFDFDNDGDVDLDDDFILMSMMDQIDRSSGNSSRNGCYIATCIYGSYDCPEVWTLRRFRDYYLAQSWLGRTFIHVYYAVSPTVASLFGNISGFRCFVRKILDLAVLRLKSNGVPDTPYQDIDWRKA